MLTIDFFSLCFELLRSKTKHNIQTLANQTLAKCTLEGEVEQRLLPNIAKSENLSMSQMLKQPSWITRN